MSDTMQKIKEATAEVLKIDIGTIGDTAKFVDDLGAESVQQVELVAAFERACGIEMDEDDWVNLTSVDGATAFIDSLLAKQS